MSWIMVDVESDGPFPGEVKGYSMVCFGAIVVDRQLDKTFFGQAKPISDLWIPDALKVSGYTREETMSFPDPQKTMSEFAVWVREKSVGRPMFISDNNGYDWQFINWYFHYFLGINPFGHSSTNLGSLYKGLIKDVHQNFKHLRKTKHTHHPVDDAKGNAEALLTMIDKMGLRMDF